MRVVVATVVHDPEDARIRHRQIESLLAAGDEVVYVAPFGAIDETVPSGHRDGLRIRPVRRAAGRHRLGAFIDARRVLAEESRTADLTVLHDPELTLLDRWVFGPILFDVHEDLVAQMEDKPWIPRPLRWLGRSVARWVESRALRRMPVVLAEESYRERLGDHPVVRNTPVVPDSVVPSTPGRVVHLGRLSTGRGADLLVAVAERLPEGVVLDLYGPVDSGLDLYTDDEVETLRLHGSIPNPLALKAIAGAAAGLALLRDRPNYRHSVPTKVLEYMAHGIPVIATPLPEVRRLLEDNNAGLIVPFDDPQAVVEAISALDRDGLRERCVQNGRRLVRDRFDWRQDAATLRRFYASVAAS
tara:strand:- start:9682 stop:10755 length:1074 start_codon:yes stop_codon:yes gene_type:complete